MKETLPVVFAPFSARAVGGVTGALVCGPLGLCFTAALLQWCFIQ